MLISHRNRFVFIHCMKAAGTSIERALGPHAEPQPSEHWALRWRKNMPSALGPLNRLPVLRDLVQYRRHTSARRVRLCIGAARWDSYRTFAFVRNPWSRLVSLYHYILSHPEVAHHAEVVRLGSFARYVRWEAALGRGRLHQHADLCDASGRVLVKFVGRFERLEADFEVITRQLGLPVSLPHENRGLYTERDYRDYYDAELRDFVGRLCARDCELFGYHFDGSVDR